MKKYVFVLFFFALSCNLPWFNHHLTEEKAREIIKYDLIHNRLKNKQIANSKISDEKSAVNIAETILFPMFGAENIKRQRPYTIGFADGYWVVYGYLPKDSKGSPFEIVLRASNGEMMAFYMGK